MRFKITKESVSGVAVAPKTYQEYKKNTKWFKIKSCFKKVTAKAFDYLYWFGGAFVFNYIVYGGGYQSYINVLAIWAFVLIIDFKSKKQ